MLGQEEPGIVELGHEEPTEKLRCAEPREKPCERSRKEPMELGEPRERPLEKLPEHPRATAEQQAKGPQPDLRKPSDNITGNSQEPSRHALGTVTAIMEAAALTTRALRTLRTQAGPRNRSTSGDLGTRHLWRRQWRRWTPQRGTCTPRTTTANGPGRHRGGREQSTGAYEASSEARDDGDDTSR